MIEVETKFHLTDRASIEDKLAKLNYLRTEPVKQVDKVYLMHSKSFKTFKRGDPVARLRTEDGSTSLTYKRVINKHGDSIEHEMKIRPESAAEGLLNELGFNLITSITKVRTAYKLGHVAVVIDEVERLGNFAEVEIVCEEDNIAEARAEISVIANQIGLSLRDIEPKKYDQLISELG